MPTFTLSLFITLQKQVNFHTSQTHDHRKWLCSICTMVLQLGSKEAQDIQVELVKQGCGASLVINTVTVLSGVTNKDATSLLLLPNFRRSTGHLWWFIVFYNV
jgi:hypothetical protein